MPRFHRRVLRDDLSCNNDIARFILPNYILFSLLQRIWQRNGLRAFHGTRSSNAIYSRTDSGIRAFHRCNALRPPPDRYFPVLHNISGDSAGMLLTDPTYCRPRHRNILSCLVSSQASPTEIISAATEYPELHSVSDVL